MGRLKTRYVVRDLSTYVRPDGGRSSSWGVLDKLLNKYVERGLDRRSDARTQAAALNKARTEKRSN